MSPRFRTQFIAVFATLAGCGGAKEEAHHGQGVVSGTGRQPAASPSGPSTAEASDFVKRVDRELRALWIEADHAAWANATDITPEHEAAEAAANEKVMEYIGKTILEARAYAKTDADPDVKRQLMLLRGATSLPAPSDAAKRKELAELASSLQATYGKGKYCKGEGAAQKCRDIGELSKVMTEARNYDAMLDAWTGWRTISREMRPKYQRFVELGNEGAKEIGYADLGDLWRSKYDMTSAEFEAEMERLWQQVKPLYEQLHCHVRAELSEKYGPEKVPANGLIPAHVLGNLWSQEWGNIYSQIEPFKGQPSIDVTRALKKAKYDPIRMVKAAEAFFVSLGLDPLPPSFWERSMFEQPKDREVVCHASAWDPSYADDLRIKMCIEINAEDLVTIHHELGHNYYYHYYHKMPVLFQQGAHDGFHEGIGDTLALSVTPAYLQKIGLLSEVSDSSEAIINNQMQDALDKIAFLPFGLLIDKWRWDVFSGKISPDRYNEAWWDLRRQYQGIDSAVPRTEEDFDPGSKYHIPGNTPYARYFLARILQFQFHESLCKAAGHQGPLWTCSIFDSKAAGDKLRAVLEMGASRDWRDALEAITGQREMDARALLEYFAPLRKYLEEQNQGRTCGWDPEDRLVSASNAP